MNIGWRLTLILALVLLNGTVKPLPGHAQSESELVIFAAASLTDAFTEIGAAFEAANPGVRVTLNFGGSSALAAQLAEGAPADVFASANPRQMMVAQEVGRIGAAPRTFAKNRLVVVIPADNPGNIQTLQDLAVPGKLLVLAAPGVPVRDYTDAMLAGLVEVPGFGEAYRAGVLANLVSEENNVRQVAAKVALGEADAGIVYPSDVTPDLANAVQTLAIPDTVNTLATYPIAITDDTPNPALAQTFVDYVLSDAGQAILERWNFISVRLPSLPPSVSLPAEGSLAVEGQVHNPLNLNAEQFQRDFPVAQVELALPGEAMRLWQGVRLWDLLAAAQVNVNADVPGDALSLFIVATAREGRQIVLSWAEVDPAYGRAPVLVVLGEAGGWRLVVPGDAQAGRSLLDLATLSVRDAPSLAAP
ncbi:molybdate ABC transporter substrate-binding protein [bacterium]|nr:molybdate ABC transporter substrate-binding protein [bacterium]